MMKRIVSELQIMIASLGLCVAGCAVAPDDSRSSEETSDEPQAEISPVPHASHTTWISVDGPTRKQVMDVRDSSVANGAVVQTFRLSGSNGTDNQRWTITSVDTQDGNTVYELQNVHSQLCLDMAIDVPAGNGVRVQQWHCNHTPNQRWISINSASSWRMLRNLQGGRCLDASHVSDADLTPLQVWDCSGNWNQRWNVL